MSLDLPPFMSLFCDIEGVSRRAKSLDSGVRPLGFLFQHQFLTVILCR